VTQLSGTLSVKKSDGTVRILSQKSSVDSGDTLNTERDSYAQIKFNDGGQLTLTHLTREDFSCSNAVESDSEGVVDHLRGVEGTVVAALVRELLEVEGRRKVSLRATDKSVDVSVIARQFGGGGHRQAAGFTTDVPLDELIERLRSEISAQL